jgi:NADH-quinone oxidoreductase subunit J
VTTGEDYQSIKVLGKILLNEYMVPFEFASILLLVAMIGTVLLLKKRKIAKINEQYFKPDWYRKLYIPE